MYHQFSWKSEVNSTPRANLERINILIVELLISFVKDSNSPFNVSLKVLAEKKTYVYHIVSQCVCVWVCVDKSVLYMYIHNRMTEIDFSL